MASDHQRELGGWEKGDAAHRPALELFGIQARSAGLGAAGPFLPMGLQRSPHECPRPMAPACTRLLRHLGLIFCWHRCAPVPEILGPPTPALKRSLEGGAGMAKQGNEKAAVQETKTQRVSLAGMFCISDELLRKLLLPQRLPLDLGQCRTSIKATPRSSLSHLLRSPSSPLEASELEALSYTGAWGCLSWEGKWGEGLAWRGAGAGLLARKELSWACLSLLGAQGDRQRGT